ncbi:MAG: hypothetical protein RLY20_1484 [Verrucomicrobiota bacterium]|jgi:hypothetical protein
MSLKAFHIFFITMAATLSAGCAAWAFKTYATPDDAHAWQLWFGIGGSLSAVALMVYLRSFLKKMKGVSYL